MKKFKPGFVTDIISDYNQTEEDFAKKVCQTNSLAQHITQKFNQKLEKNGLKSNFQYSTLHFGKVTESSDEVFKQNDVITVEEYLTGTFAKYINNTGEICTTSEGDEFIERVSALAHFSYEHYERRFMLVDIQGRNKLNVSK